ncbi:Stk1 family PASTA domain-containing Ser/Thr kinase [Amycolatopsis samaneae]|uniref:non-specific serine/threonine protein kinase n=1 Tax=Amycolatopsis samaneae TaxID=664691 RepID=A0ABW5GP13_9PSEU
MTSTHASLVGTLLEQRYRVDRLLARGGMSSVYRGTDTRLDRQVAIKIMDPRFADDRSFVDRFVREARSAAQLHHPHVVAVHDQGFDGPAGDEPGYAFLVMELVDGGTLRDLMDANGPLEFSLALTIAEQALTALAAAHTAGLVHRDVKPENVLIGRGATVGSGGVVKVADFGLVRAVASAGTTSSSVILGTVGYLSPEQVTTGVTTARGDVYSAGILLFEMLTGQAPYTGDTAISVAYRHVNDDVPRPGELRPELPPALDELVLRATRRDPEQRPADAGVLLSELLAVRAELGLPVVPIPVPPPPDAAESDTERTTRIAPVTDQTLPVTGPQGTRALTRTAAAPPPPPPPAEPPMPAEEARQPRDRKRTIALIAAAVLVLGGLIGAFAFILTDSAPNTVTVPMLAGKNQADAGDALRAAKLVPQFNQVFDNTAPANTVIRSDPAAGTTLAPNSTVTVSLSKGRPVVPDIKPGTPAADAERALQAVQLTSSRGTPEYSNEVAQGAVIRTDPQPGSPLDIGSQVALVLSKGPEPLPPVPDVTGRTQDEAFKMLKQAGFEPVLAGEEFKKEVAAGSVTRTNPAGGSSATSRQVGVYVSNAVEVPDVRLKQLDDAEKILAAAGLKSDRKGKGHGGFQFVIDQDPKPGERVKKGSEIQLRVFG